MLHIFCVVRARRIVFAMVVTEVVALPRNVDLCSPLLLALPPRHADVARSNDLAVATFVDVDADFVVLLRLRLRLLLRLLLDGRLGTVPTNL